MNRHREKTLLWLRSLAFGSLVYWALMSMDFNPAVGAAGVAIAIMLLAFFSAGLAVFAAVIALSLPIIASNLLLGAIFLVIALAAIQYLAYDHGINFLLIIGGMAAAFAGPAWALPIFAGYLLGASQGAVVAILVCLLIEAAGLSVSAPVIGFVYTGVAEGTPLLINAASALPTLAGLSISASELDPSAVLHIMAQAQPKEILVIQPLLWGLGAAITGAICRMKLYRRVVMASIGTVAGVAVLAVGHMALTIVFFGTQPDYLTVISAVVISILLALAGIAASEYLFPPAPKQVASATPLSGLRSEEADVDDLLRLIATAEDELMARHTAHSVVMLTDMKAFSKMTDRTAVSLRQKLSNACVTFSCRSSIITAERASQQEEMGSSPLSAMLRRRHKRRYRCKTCWRSKMTSIHRCEKCPSASASLTVR